MSKRLFDLIVATVGILVLSPVFVITAIRIKLDSRGPVLYRGIRTGRYGRPFRMLKFRSMIVGAETLGGTSTGLQDPRVTRVGRSLRRYKLDELPQLLNVLSGEMSMVGPLPVVVEYTRLYSSDEMQILSVRPGITDYASIEFSNLAEALGPEDVDRIYAEKVRPIKNQLRLKYVREHSFWGDIGIIIATLRRIARH
jgi:lipopolysaccharide/colanic/teichoic acid biosynthesis glycosyltransferase